MMIHDHPCWWTPLTVSKLAGFSEALVPSCERPSGVGNGQRNVLQERLNRRSSPTFQTECSGTKGHDSAAPAGPWSETTLGPAAKAVTSVVTF